MLKKESLLLIVLHFSTFGVSFPSRKISFDDTKILRGAEDLSKEFGRKNNMSLAANSSSDCNCGRVFSDEALALRVAGGQEIGIKDHPFLAILLVQNLFSCGGSIVSNTFILTAAHCIPDYFNIDDFLVKVGIHDRLADHGDEVRSLRVQEILKHKHFQRTKFNILVNDIALLRVNKIEFNDYIQPICLPITNDLIEQYKSAVIQGWGYTNSNKKKHVRFPRQTVVSLLTQEQCSRSPISRKIKTVKDFSKMILCAYKPNSDACQGDSGGPLILRTVSGIMFQIGIVSFGAGCGNSLGWPGLYTRLFTYRDWLQQNLQGSMCTP